MVLWLGLRCELFRGFALHFFSLRFFSSHFQCMNFIVHFEIRVNVTYFIFMQILLTGCCVCVTLTLIGRQSTLNVSLFLSLFALFLTLLLPLFRTLHLVRTCRVFLHSAQNVTEIIRSMGAIPMDINLKRKERNTEAVETKYKIKSRTHYTRAASRIYM